MNCKILNALENSELKRHRGQMTKGSPDWFAGFDFDFMLPCQYQALDMNKGH